MPYCYCVLDYIHRPCKMSAEPRRKKAYSIDLRWRVVYQRIGIGLTFQKISRNLNIAASTAHLVLARFERTGNVEPVCSKCSYELRTLDEESELFVNGAVLSNPGMYLRELCQQLREVVGVEAAPSTVCRLLRAYGITRKRIRLIASQRCESLRGAFMAQCSLFATDMFVWVDEMGSDRRHHSRRYGYAIRGATPVCHRLLSRGRRYNAIAAITSTGLLVLELTKSTVNADVFFDFCRGHLIPNMRTYDGTTPQSILIMDNLSVHHTSEVIDLFIQAGILVIMTPYSPDLNPIEEAFSYIKNYLRTHQVLLDSLPDPTAVITSAFRSITDNHCQAWILHAGYYK